MGRPRKIKVELENKSVTTGNLGGNASVYDYLRNREFPYKEETLAGYRKHLDTMNLSDLQKHAIEIAHIIPNITERHRLVDKLERKYLERQAVFMTKFSNNAVPKTGVTPEQAQTIINILNNRGR